MTHFGGETRLRDVPLYQVLYEGGLPAPIEGELPFTVAADVPVDVSPEDGLAVPSQLRPGERVVPEQVAWLTVFGPSVRAMVEMRELQQ